MADTKALSILRVTGQAIAHRIAVMKTRESEVAVGYVGVLTFIGIVVYMGFPSQGLEFCFAGNAKRCTGKQMPFMAREGDCASAP